MILPESVVESDMLEPLIEYCYTGKMEISPDNVESVLYTSRLLLLDKLTMVNTGFCAYYSAVT